MFEAILRLQPLAIEGSKDEGTGESDVTTMVRSATRGLKTGERAEGDSDEAGSAGVGD